MKRGAGLGSAGAAGVALAVGDAVTDGFGATAEGRAAAVFVGCGTTGVAGRWGTCG